MTGVVETKDPEHFVIGNKYKFFYEEGNGRSGYITGHLISSFNVGQNTFFKISYQLRNNEVRNTNLNVSRITVFLEHTEFDDKETTTKEEVTPPKKEEKKKKADTVASTKEVTATTTAEAPPPPEKSNGSRMRPVITD